MERQISSQELRAQLGEAIDAVRLRGDRYIIERRGKPVAALVPMEMLEREREQRGRLADLFEQMRSRGPGLPEEEAMDVALDEIRQHRVEKRQS